MMKAWVVSVDWVSDVVETLPIRLAETIAVPTTELEPLLLPVLAWLESVKTVVEGGVLGCKGGLPAAVFVEPVSLLFGFVFSVCCGRFGNCCFPVS